MIHTHFSPLISFFLKTLLIVFICTKMTMEKERERDRESTSYLYARTENMGAVNHLYGHHLGACYKCRCQALA